MKKILFTILAAVFLPLVSHGQIIKSETKTFDFVPDDTKELTFQSIEELFGGSINLNDIISISITGSITQSEGSIGLTNQSDTVVNFNASHTATASFSSEDLTLPTDFGEYEYSKTQPFSGTLNPKGQSGDSASTAITGGSSGTIGSSGNVDGDDYGEFLNTPLVIKITGVQKFNVETGGVDQNYSPSRLTGSVTITYEVVPEPSIAILLGLSCFIMLLRRHRY